MTIMLTPAQILQARHVHPDAVSGWAVGLHRNLRAEMLANPRIAPRICAALLGQGPDVFTQPIACSEEVARCLLSYFDAPERVRALLGIALRWSTFAQKINGAALRAALGSLSPELVVDAVRLSRDLQLPARMLGSQETIEAVACRALAQWAGTLDSALAGCVRLTLPPLLAETGSRAGTENMQQIQSILNAIAETEPWVKQ